MIIIIMEYNNRKIYKDRVQNRMKVPRTTASALTINAPRPFSSYFFLNKKANLLYNRG